MRRNIKREPMDGAKSSLLSSERDAAVHVWFSVYSGIWVLEQATALLGAAKRWSDWRVVGMVGLMLYSSATDAAVGASSKYWTMCGALMLSCALIWERIPFVWPSMWWCLQTDAALLWCLLRYPRTTQALDQARRIVQWQFGILYLAAGFCKFNSAYLDPGSSCSTVFVAQLVAQYVPQLATNILSLAIKVTPIASAVWEMGIGLAMLSGHRVAVAAGIGLHGVISATPVPNNISTFSAKCAARYLFLLSPESVAECEIGKFMLPVYLAMLFHFQPNSAQDWALAAFAPTAILYLYIVSVSRNGEMTKKPFTLSFLPWIVLALSNACVGPITGLQDLGAPSMYSNFKTHGGSNHLLLPTGLVHEMFATEPNSIFYGGVVRVEATTSRWIADLYPNELSPDLEPKESIFALLADLGYHAPRFFNGAKSRVLGPRPNNTVFVPFTIPAFELRRLLDEARLKDGTFDITLARLPGTKGDEGWRSKAIWRRLNVHFSLGQLSSCFQAPAGDNGRQQYVHVCTDDDLLLLNSTGVLRSSWRHWFARKLLVSLPYPILDPPTPQILCFGP